MEKYKSLTQLLDDDLTDQRIVVRDADDVPTTRSEVRTCHLLLVLLIINLALAIANGWTTHLVTVSVQRVLPVGDVSMLAQPDQYAGLPEHARWKTFVRE
ncbi:hypothetical protein BV25DRAFT_1920200 [Artomyces pyxidatus]|uniref:Uncharacterized protein n=1 Tax=Artomyces pyxidatus TaxID=48021 RepID=A0ACB8SM90_9AGAM|nr:hypothetical protein BV25DRAFT_1920200 [Artomyces pyxidatus]